LSNTADRICDIQGDKCPQILQVSLIGGCQS
jgi:hypothetical protein